MLNIEDNVGDTALKWATRNGASEIESLLIAAGAATGVQGGNEAQDDARAKAVSDEASKDSIESRASDAEPSIAPKYGTMELS